MNRKSIGATIPAALLMILFCFIGADAQGFLPGGGTGRGSSSNVPLNNQAVHYRNGGALCLRCAERPPARAPVTLHLYE
jgi:hypothetical protein